MNNKMSIVFALRKRAKLIVEAEKLFEQAHQTSRKGMELSCKAGVDFAKDVQEACGHNAKVEWKTDCVVVDGEMFITKGV